MAPVYTARHVGASDRTIPLFSLKGLPNYAPTTVSLCGVMGTPLETQVAYSEYEANLCSFLHASITNRRVRISTKPLGYLSTSSVLPLSAPAVHFTLRKEIPNDQQEKLLRILGTGASKSLSGKTTIFQAPALQPDSLSRILPLASTHFNAGRDAVNPMGLKAFWLISNAFAELLRVHSYAAFTTESNESLVEMTGLLAEHGMEYVVYNKRNEPDHEERSVFLNRHAPEEDDEGDEGMNVDSSLSEEDRAMVDILKAAKGYITSNGRDIVVYAHPPRSPVINIGSSAQVPELPGILFPYFHGLVQPDQQSLMRFVHTYLLPYLGMTVQECQETYAELRRGFNSLSTTDVGMALSHVGLGLQLALKTQTRCFVVCDKNQYQGFTLLGARFAIFDSVKWVRPVESAALRDDLAAIDPHIASVKSLVTLFGELTAADSYNGPAVTEETFDEPRNLIEVFAGLRLDAVGDRERELNRLVRNLNYMGDGYLARNPQVIKEVLTTLFSEATIELGRPTYIPSVRAALSSRAFQLLSRFGPEAPSFWNERGQEFECQAREIPATTGTKRKIGELDVYANMPSRLLITPKPLDIAVKDMEKVMEKGCVRMDLKERAGKNRNMSVEAESARKDLWKVLVEGLHDVGNKKRKVDRSEKNVVGENLNFDDALKDLLG